MGQTPTFDQSKLNQNKRVEDLPIGEQVLTLCIYSLLPSMPVFHLISISQAARVLPAPQARSPLAGNLTDREICSWQAARMGQHFLAGPLVRAVMLR